MEPVSGDVRFPQLEERISQFWADNGIIEKGLEANKGSESFVFYDGPPFATGLPHYGHLLAGTLKDVVPRYWVMRGKYVSRRWGWDCHGLPVEFEMEKELNLGGREEVEKFGVANFNEACRGIVLRYTAEWRKIIERTGRWVNFDDNYRTMDTPYMESVWWVFKQLWDQGLIFEGHRVMPYSWRIATPLSNFEAGLNYKEVQDPAVSVKLKAHKGDNRYFLAWTTTPWTLPSNLALAVGKDIDYVEIKDTESGEIYVLAQARVAALYKDESQYKQVRSFKGAELIGETYEPLFPYFADKKNEGAFKVLEADFVSTEDGTGIVHMAPAFGEDDYNVCQKNKLPLVDPVDRDGKFTDEVPEYKGQPVKEADKNIIKDLKAANKVFRHDTIVHNYPFCWRSDTPLIYKAISTWFVKLEPIKAKLIENNKKTHWVPEHLRDGRFGNWLENARDWNISRNRFWGTPLPIWRNEETGESLCVGSVKELEDLTGQKLDDIHKHFVDDLVIKSPKTGDELHRVEEVLDCWFESGSMPYAQVHYPFENKETFEANFPAQFIAEGIDQTRGWFYTLSVLATALFDKPPFQHVIVNGMVLAEDGKKMSKRLKNYPDPAYVLDTYGADALRAYITTSPAAYAQDLRFSEAGIKEVVRAVLLPYWNAYSFFVTYALADGWKVSNFDESKLDSLSVEMDQWIVSRLQSLVKTVNEKMEIYHLYEVVPSVVHFIDELTNWYIRLNRRRFWDTSFSEDKESAYNTLYYVLREFSKVMAPIMPFMTEAIYQNLKTADSSAESVHLCKFPEANDVWIREPLEKQMSLVERVVTLARTVRATNKLKTRQPLKELLVITKNPEDQKTIEHYQELIQGELNVKEVLFSSQESKWVKLKAKANAKVLGPRLGKKMKAVLIEVKNLSPAEVAKIAVDGGIRVLDEWISEEEITLEREPLKAGAIQTEGDLTVFLDTALDAELISEGRARELVNRIQKLRKDLDFQVTDRIVVHYDCPQDLDVIMQAHRDYIAGETLADDFNCDRESAAWDAEHDIDGFALRLRLVRV